MNISFGNYRRTHR